MVNTYMLAATKLCSIKYLMKGIQEILISSLYFPIFPQISYSVAHKNSHREINNLIWHSFNKYLLKSSIAGTKVTDEYGFRACSQEF